MENRTITVKGVGTARVKPDYVVIRMGLAALDKEYDKAMKQSADKLDELSGSLISIGFKKDDLKTDDLNVNADYDTKQHRDGRFERVFRGYAVRINLKLSFDFDNERLSKVLGTIAGTDANLDMQIAFTVKDAAGVKDELLRSAAENAKRKAEVLCSASGVSLGALQSINYNWAELEVYSRTTYNLAERAKQAAPMSVDIEPDDIDVGDTATFVWSIE